MFSDDKENMTHGTEKTLGCDKLFRGPTGFSSPTTRGQRTPL